MSFSAQARQLNMQCFDCLLYNFELTNLSNMSLCGWLTTLSHRSALCGRWKYWGYLGFLLKIFCLVFFYLTFLLFSPFLARSFWLTVQCNIWSFLCKYLQWLNDLSVSVRPKRFLLSAARLASTWPSSCFWASPWSTVSGSTSAWPWLPWWTPATPHLPRTGRWSTPVLCPQTQTTPRTLSFNRRG